ncbi:DNA helicase RecQ [Flexithrix dorotheae]|uniref:DNA helicase RecQ n=1 Tax=Flexithrix dorotheae TaxID=70993 RepID=UPI00036678EC|nr:DNA helicase RecQ [Flexithrix dorotheae]
MVITEKGDILRNTLKEVFGYNQFRGNQEKIINNIMSGRNTFVIMPTGAGKSMCYQLPAIIQEGTAVVISPLIALMKNQVDQLNAFGINAHFLNSTLSKTEINKVKKQLLNGEMKLLYVAPESLTKEENIALLKKANLSFVAVDEAHCISEWGHDFRPEYRRIKTIIEDIGNLPIIALTATATPKVRSDIQKNLKMEEADIFISSFHRKNLFYEVRPKQNSKKQLIKFVHQYKGKAGIVYCLSRKKVEEIAELLKVNGVKALPYHAGMDSSLREKHQDAFLSEDADVIVATIAFGMGIDKPDVRFVIHYDAPKSIEGYYQETGRAGRDGLDSHCLMFFSEKDINKLEKFNKDKPVTERDNAKHLLKEVSYYANSSVCRHRQLLHYFGEYLDKDYGFCDNTKKDREEFNGKNYLLTVLQTVLQTGERFNMEHIVDVICANDSQYVTSYTHNKLDVYGKHEGKDNDFWVSVVRQAMIHKLLVKDIDEITVLKLTEEGHNFLENPKTITLTKDHDYSNIKMDEEEDSSNNVGHAQAADETLFELLKGLRKKLAKQKDLPPYVIFQDPSLEEMATIYPCTEDDLSKINGVGMGKIKKFGKPFIELIKNYVEENDIVTASDVVVKSAVNKSKTKIFIIQQIDRMVDLDEISESLGIDYFNVIDEIENICFSGTKLNLDYYIEQIMDDEREEDIWSYFMEAETDSLEDAIEELGDDYSEEEIRLMRVKFMSEVAF